MIYTQKINSPNTYFIFHNLNEYEINIINGKIVGYLPKQLKEKLCTQMNLE